jgi:hypothetical protein
LQNAPSTAQPFTTITFGPTWRTVAEPRMLRLG